MKIWTNNQFKGHYPTGTAAVVVAETAKQAAALLTLALGKEGLGPVGEDDMKELFIKTGQVRILCDGMY